MNKAFVNAVLAAGLGFSLGALIVFVAKLSYAKYLSSQTPSASK